MPSVRLRPFLAVVLAAGAALLALPRLAGAVTRPYAPVVDVQAANVFLQGPKGVVLPSSASGAHLYVTGGPGVVGLRRDAVTGTVRFLDRLDVDPAGLSTGEGALSPDGLFLYVPSTTTSPFSGFEVSIFTRNPVTGALTPAGGATLAGGANAVAVSPDGAHVYATGLGLAVFARDAGTGALTPVETQTIANGSGVDVSPDGAHVYVTRPADDAITMWARDAGTGALTPAGTVADGVGGADGLDGVTDLVISPDGQHAYAAGELEDAVAVFARSAGTGMLSYVEAAREGAAGVTGLVRPAGIAVSPDGAHVYASAGPNAGLGAAGALVAFARDAATGVLTHLGTVENGGGVEGLGGGALGISADGLFLYSSAGTSLAVLGRTLSGTATFVQRRSGFGGFALQGARDLSPSPDGRHVYVGSEIDRAVSIFRVSSADGALVFSDAVYQGEQPGLSGVRSVATSPDGTSVYAASADTGTIAIFDRDAAFGELTYVGEVVEGVGGVGGLGDPAAMAVSPDGAHLYVLGGATTSLTAFARDGGTGLLTFVETLTEGVGGVGGLAAPIALAVSPDGASVYVVGAPGTVATFGRDPGAGTLTHLGTITDGQSGAEQLGGARDVAVTPDGTQVVVAAETDGAMVVFARDAGTGALTPAETVRDAVGVGSLSAPTAVLVHPDGATVLVVADAPAFGGVPALWAFDRDPGGALSFVNVRSLADVLGIARFGPGDDAYAIQIGFGLRLYRFTPGFAGCDVTPRTDCKVRGTDGRSKLAVKVRTPSKPVLKWKWSNGEATFAADVARLAADGAAWCLYDESGGTPALLTRALAPGDAVRWRAASPTKFKYKDKGRLPEGVLGMLVSTSSSSGRAKLKVRGSGANLALPVPALPLPVRVQLQGTSGCWEATFSSAGARRNDAGQFIGGAD